MNPSYQTSIYDYKIDINQNACGYQNQAIVTTTVNSTSPGLYFNSSTDGAQVGQITLDTLHYLMMEGTDSSTSIHINTNDVSMCSNTSNYSNTILLSSNVNNNPQLLLTNNNKFLTQTSTIILNPGPGDFITSTDFQNNSTNIGSKYFILTGESGEIGSFKSDGINSTLDLSGTTPNITINGQSGNVGQVLTYTGNNIAWKNAPFYYYLELDPPSNNGNVPWNIINYYLTNLTKIPLVIMTADSGNNYECIQVSSAGSNLDRLYWASASNIVALSILVYSRG